MNGWSCNVILDLQFQSADRRIWTFLSTLFVVYNLGFFCIPGFSFCRYIEISSNYIFSLDVIRTLREFCHPHVNRGDL